MRHDTLSSKAILAISIDRAKEIWKINRLTNSKSPLLQFHTLEVMTNKKRKREEKKKRLSIYLNSEGMHEASDV